ncbi:MAG: FAD-dependent oxidoreductase [Ignavibacteria bacterium]|nr:FAD-dependent oxidoreductase [Ignavibacteria bacterium]
MNIKRKIVVIGGSAAGPSAAAKAKRTNPVNDVILYEMGKYISIGTCEIPYVLSGLIDDSKKIIFYTPEKFYEEKGVLVNTTHKVESINASKKSLVITNLQTNQKFEDSFDKLILCTGSRAKCLTAFRSTLKNVFYLKTIDDLIRIEQFIKENKVKSSVVIGAGLIGLESIDFLSKFSESITFIDKEPLPLPSFSKEVRQIILDFLEEKGYLFIGNVNDFRTTEKDNLVSALTIGTQKIECDLVLVAIGFEPSSELAISAGLVLNKDNTIKVDKKLNTSDSNIYSAGDCISVEEFITKKQMWLPLATLAHNFGHVAGANASGESIYAPSVVRNIILKVGNYSIAQVGLTEKEMSEKYFKFSIVSSFGNSRVHIMPGGEKHFIKIFYENGSKKILGANLIGGEDIVGKANLISLCIKNRIALDKLSEVDFGYTPPLSPFIETLSVLSKKASK